jgi:hypothetical protein
MTIDHTGGRKPHNKYKKYVLILSSQPALAQRLIRITFYIHYILRLRYRDQPVNAV